MAYGKQDFVNFSDLDLNSLLVDFTESEFDSDEGKRDTSVKDTQKSKPKPKEYQCDECDKSYASISGIRGHLRSKHGKQNIRVSQYRQRDSTPAAKPDPFELNEANFSSLLHGIFPETLQNIVSCKFRNLKRSANGEKVISLAKSLLQNLSVSDKLLSVLQPCYIGIFNRTSGADNNTKETLLKAFYELTYNEELNNKLSAICEELGEDTPPRQFVAVLHRQLLSDLIDNRAKLYETATPKKEAVLSDSEQSTVFYIGGYILSQLQKRHWQTEKEVLATFFKNENNSEKTFVTKFSEWTSAVSRGGLKCPSDNFFLFLRECEICLRKNGNECSYVGAKEMLMEDHMVKYYSEKVLDGKCASHIIEQCVVIYLNVRGPAAARHKKQNLMAVPDSSKSMRKVLEDLSNKDSDRFQ